MAFDLLNKGQALAQHAHRPRKQRGQWHQGEHRKRGNDVVAFPAQPGDKDVATDVQHQPNGGKQRQDNSATHAIADAGEHDRLNQSDDHHHRGRGGEVHHEHSPCHVNPVLQQRIPVRAPGGLGPQHPPGPKVVHEQYEHRARANTGLAEYEQQRAQQRNDGADASRKTPHLPRRPGGRKRQGSILGGQSICAPVRWQHRSIVQGVGGHGVQCSKGVLTGSARRCRDCSRQVVPALHAKADPPHA